MVVNDLKFLSKEMGIFEGRKERSECLQKLYDALMNISPTSAVCPVKECSVLLVA